MLPAGSSVDEIVLEAYRLADWYKQNPEVFLNMPMGDVYLHRYRTYQLIQLQARERAAREEDG